MKTSMPFGLSLSKPGLPFDRLRANGYRTERHKSCN